MTTATHNQKRPARRGWSDLRSASIERRIAVIVGVHVALALLWSVVVPLGEGPDEPGHFAYPLFVAATNRLPVQRAQATASDVPGEGHQPPLAYWLMQPAVRWLPAEERILQMGANPRFRWNGGDQPNAFFRSSRDIPPYQGLALAWHLARGVSALLGGATVWLTYLTARRLIPDLALSAAALLAFNPQFIFAHALVSNDPLLITLASGLIYSCIRIVAPEQRDSRRWAVVVGVLLGALLLTKLSALALIPLPLLALALRRTGWRRLLGDGLIVLGTTVLLAGWWFVRNQQLYGDPLGLRAFQEAFATSDFDITAWSSWRGGLWSLLRSSWGMFGWLTLPLNDGAYWVFATFLALGLIGLVARVADGLWHGRGRETLILGSAVLLMLGWTVAFAQTAGSVAWQGRFIFPAAVALAIGLAVGLRAALPRGAALWLLLGLLLVLALALPRGLIVPAYPGYVLPPQQVAADALYARFDPGYARGVELRGLSYAARMPTGSMLDVTFTWHALEQLDRPWQQFVHIVDASGAIVAERNVQPFDGAFPTTAWVRGDWIRDTPRVSLEGVSPGRYTVRVGLWDEQRGVLQAVFDRTGEQLGIWLDVGPLVVTER